MIETLSYKDKIYAVIVRRTFDKMGVNFVTPNDLSQQLAYIHHPEGEIIEPHVHNPLPRKVQYTQEVLLIRRGRLQVDFYTDEQEFLESRILEGGDVIMLIRGGHGFKILEEVEMFEVKQGPYAGEADKTRFRPTDNPRS